VEDRLILVRQTVAVADPVIIGTTVGSDLEDVIGVDTPHQHQMRRL
jgi:hypothetical protein